MFISSRLIKMKFKLPWTVCRVCLREGQMYSLFQKDTKGMSIAEKLALVVDIKIVPDKNLPQEICRRCMILLNSAHRFQLQCKKSEFLLQMSVRHRAQKDIRSKQHAVVLTLSNGKIFEMPKDVTVRKKSATTEASDASPQIEAQTKVSEVDVARIGESLVEAYQTKKSMAMHPTLKRRLSEFNGNRRKCQKRVRVPENDSRDIDIAVQNASQNDADEVIPPPQGCQNALQIIEDIRVAQPNTDTNLAERTYLNQVQSNPQDIVLKFPPGPHVINEKNGRDVRPSLSNIPPNDDTGLVLICELCGNRYRSKTGFDIHMRLHRNERPYKCEICHAAFVQSSKLTTHMRRHTGERPYACSFCSRRFIKNESKLLHERMHTGEKPYECDICNKRFSYACVLTRHKLIHTNNEKNFICAPCGKRFRFKYHLNAHMKTSTHQFS